MGRDSATSLAPGFRFHPTDEELVRYYLKRKVTGKRFRFDAISEVDVYKVEPWDLPSKSKLKSRDLEWYFFSGLDKKYGNGSRTNRATQKGYWKTTGKDRPVYFGSRTVGMKKTLVYHSGRAPRGQRTNWVMHEYRLADEEMEKAGIAQDAFVLCRIFQKSGPGPKNGEQYGAPFIEEEWEDEEDDDEVAYAPFGGSSEAHGLDYDDEEDAYFDVNDLQKDLDAGKPAENVPNADIPPEKGALPLDFYYDGETCIYVKDLRDVTGDDQKRVTGVLQIHDGSENAPLPVNFYHGETSNHVRDPHDVTEDDQKPITDPFKTHGRSENALLPLNFYHGEIDHCRRNPQEFTLNSQKPDVGPFGPSGSELSDHQKLIDSLGHQNPKLVEREHPELDNNAGPDDINYLLDEPYMDASDNPVNGDGLFLETNDLSNSVEADPSGFDMLEEYLTFFDTGDEILDNMASDSSHVAGTENSVSEQAAVSHQASMLSKHLLGTQDNNDASSSKQIPDAKRLKSNMDYPFIKQASHMLENIHAPPAVAAEFPTKQALLRLNSASQSSSSVQVLAGMIRVSNTTVSGNGMDMSFSKSGDVNFVLTYGVSQGAGPSVSSLLSGKNGFSVRALGYLLFIWVIILSVSFKIGTSICAHQ